MIWPPGIRVGEVLTAPTGRAYRVLERGGTSSTEYGDAYVRVVTVDGRATITGWRWVWFMVRWSRA